MSRKKALALIGFLLLDVASAIAAANVQEVRLYALECGRININNMGAMFSDTGEYAGEPGEISDPCFLIQHPKGTLIWDTGLSDKFAETRNGVDIPAYSIHVTVSTRLVDQLRQLHLTPDEITYVAFSHFHFDHTGNAGMFSHSTWIVNKAELMNAQQTPVAPGIDPDIAGEAKATKLQMIDGDYDVFGDGSVRIFKTPGHTPGHQSLEIKLKNSGIVLLTGDLYHLRSSRKLHLVPPVNSERADTLASMDRFERIAKNTGPAL